MKKKGQVTIFVILAIILVVLTIIIYSLVGGPTSRRIDVDEDPEIFIRDCLEDDFWIYVDNVSLNGGSVNPELYKNYYGANVEYLCYTPEEYKLCSIYNPFLTEHIEYELLYAIQDKIDSCFLELQSVFEEKGYTIMNFEKGEYEVELSPDVINLIINSSITIKKGNQESTTFDNFDMQFYNNLYELVQISKGIIEWEALLGKADLQELRYIFTDFEITRDLAEYETKIYKIKDRTTKDEFQFASRSLAFPSGML